MRHLLFVIMMFAFAADLAAQEQTLFKGDFEKGGFGGMVVKFTSIYDQSAVMVGGRGGATNYVKDAGAVIESNEQAGESDFVFVLEPAVNAKLNVTNWFHLNAWVSYRLVTGVKQEGLKDSDFRGMNATLTFKFGKF